MLLGRSSLIKTMIYARVVCFDLVLSIFRWWNGSSTSTQIVDTHNITSRNFSSSMWLVSAAIIAYVERGFVDFRSIFCMAIDLCKAAMAPSSVVAAFCSANLHLKISLLVSRRHSFIMWPSWKGRGSNMRRA